MHAHPEGFLARLARTVLRRPGAVAAGALVVTVVAGVVGLPPRVDPDLIALLPADEPHAMALQQVAQEAGGVNTITLTFDGSQTELDGVLYGLADALTALPEVHTALYRLDPDLARFRALARHSVAEVQAVTDAIASGDPGWRASPVVLGLDEPDHLLVPSDGYGRIVVKPTRSNVDPAFSEQVVQAVQRTIDETDLGPVTHVHSAGPYVFNAASSSGIRDDFVRTSGVTALLVLAVLAIGLRSLRAPVVVFVPIVVAGVVNLAVLRVVLGSMNAFTSFGTALLIGLGIDFAVHLMARFRELRSEGIAFEDAVALAWARTGPVCAVAALTSAAGFAVWGLSDFNGLGHLGLALCSGLLVSLASMLVLLPPLLRFVDRPVVTRAPRASWTLSTRVARGAVAIVGLLSVVALLTGLPRVRFEYDLTRLNRDDFVFSEMDTATRELVRQGYPPIVLTLPDEVAVRTEHRRLQDLMDEGALPHVREVVSIASLLPDDVEPRVRAMRRLVDAAEAADVLPELHGWTPRAWSEAELPAGLVDLVGGGRRVLMLPTGDLFDLRESSALIDEVDAVAPGAGSEQLAQGAVFRMVTRDTPRFTALAFMVVALVVAFDLRRLRPVVLTVGSLLVGALWAMAALGWLGVHLTLMNLIGLPILLGLGVDGVLHLAHRLRDGASAGEAVHTVGRASALSVLTTLVSFVSLMAAGSGGLRSLGTLVVVGLMTVTAVSSAALLLVWAAWPQEHSR